VSNQAACWSTRQPEESPGTRTQIYGHTLVGLDTAMGCSRAINLLPRWASKYPLRHSESIEPPNQAAFILMSRVKHDHLCSCPSCSWLLVQTTCCSPPPPTEWGGARRCTRAGRSCHRTPTDPAEEPAQPAGHRGDRGGAAGAGRGATQRAVGQPGEQRRAGAGARLLAHRLIRKHKVAWVTAYPTPTGV
jgi:hypothetical protein